VRAARVLMLPMRKCRNGRRVAAARVRHPRSTVDHGDEAQVQDSTETEDGTAAQGVSDPHQIKIIAGPSGGLVRSCLCVFLLFAALAEC